VEALVVVLAIGGVGAILRSLVRTMLRFGLGAAAEAAAVSQAEQSALRGDLTGLAERREMAIVARRQRRRDMLLSALWLGWLVLPPFLGVAGPVYALAAPLWLIAPPRVR